MSKVKRAIAIIESCRETHARWARWQQSLGKGWDTEVRGKAIGGPVFHRRWVKKYDLVLEVLRACAQK